MGGLHAQLYAMSKITLQSVDAYQMSINNLGEVVDKCVADTSVLVSKADELNAEMAPIHNIAAQIKEIKRILEILENACAHLGLRGDTRHTRWFVT